MQGIEITQEMIGDLEAVAKAATPGPWSWWTSNSFRRLSSDATGKEGDVLHGFVARDGCPDIAVTTEDADYIAAANPQTVLALIAEIRRLQSELDKSDECARHAYELLASFEGEP